MVQISIRVLLAAAVAAPALASVIPLVEEIDARDVATQDDLFGRAVVEVLNDLYGREELSDLFGRDIEELTTRDLEELLERELEFDLDARDFVDDVEARQDAPPPPPPPPAAAAGGPGPGPAAPPAEKPKQLNLMQKFAKFFRDLVHPKAAAKEKARKAGGGGEPAPGAAPGPAPAGGEAPPPAARSLEEPVERSLDFAEEMLEREIDTDVFERDLFDDDLFERDIDTELFERDFFDEELMERDFDGELYERDVEDLLERSFEDEMFERSFEFDELD